MNNWIKELVDVTEADLKAKWSGVGTDAFFCAFCQHDLTLGMQFRMIYTNDMPGAYGNPLACGTCVNQHGVEGLRTIWKQMWQEYRTKFRWWTVR